MSNTIEKEIKNLLSEAEYRSFITRFMHRVSNYQFNNLVNGEDDIEDLLKSVVDGVNLDILKEKVPLLYKESKLNLEALAQQIIESSVFKCEPQSSIIDYKSAIVTNNIYPDVVLKIEGDSDDNSYDSYGSYSDRSDNISYSYSFVKRIIKYERF